MNKIAQFCVLNLKLYSYNGHFTTYIKDEGSTPLAVVFKELEKIVEKKKRAKTLLHLFVPTLRTISDILYD